MCSWLLQRITGAILVIGMAVHIKILPLGGRIISFEEVSSRLSNPGWLMFDIVLLSCCLYHGFNGLWQVVLDYSPKGKRGFGWLIFIIGAAMLILGLAALIPLSQIKLITHNS